MIINYFNFTGIAGIPCKNNTPLIIDTDALPDFFRFLISK